MNPHYAPAQFAVGAIKRSIARLAGKYPFHAKVLEQFRLTTSPAVGTLGVAAATGGVQLLHNPEFVLSLPTDQLVGVLLHEVHHVVLGHLTINPTDYPDQWALTVALEVSVNEFVRESLPPGAIRLEQFPMLPPMESSGQRYRRLEQVKDRFVLSVPLVGTIVETEGMFVGVLDNHEVWQGTQYDSEATRQAVAELVHQAAVEAGDLPEGLLLAAGIASASGMGLQTISNDRDGKLDWRRLLRRYAGRVLQSRPVFQRSPRRFPDLLGIIPGRRRVGAKVSVVAIIDTSSSISVECLEEIDGELHQLNRSHPVHVIECDSEVQRTYRYHGRLEYVRGCGGTDFRPALDPAFLRPLRPGLIVYFTDGDGEAPEQSPPWPIIWCLTPGGQAPATYGRVIDMFATE